MLSRGGKTRYRPLCLLSVGSAHTLLYGWRQMVGNDYKDADMESGGGVIEVMRPITKPEAEPLATERTVRLTEGRNTKASPTMQ